VLLLSIRPRFVELILDGRKTVELRRAPIVRDISHVVMYATRPVKKVVGWFEVADVERASPQLLWRRHGTTSGLSRREFFAYFEGADQGTAIQIGRVVAFDVPLGLSDFGSPAAPQNTRYISAGKSSSR
jgi:predicted transcriptional regulator